MEKHVSEDTSEAAALNPYGYPVIQSKDLNMNIHKKVLFVVLVCVLAGFGCKQSTLFQKSDDPDAGKPYLGLVKMSFVHVETNESVPIAAATLIRYRREIQDEGVEVKRWEGDTGSQYKYIEIEKRELRLNNFAGGSILLKSGIYQIKHVSASGQPPSGYYGKSNIFEIKVGQEPVEIQILLNPAI